MTAADSRRVTAALLFHPLPEGAGAPVRVEVAVPEALPSVLALFPDHRETEWLRTASARAPAPDLLLRPAATGFELVSHEGTWRDGELPGLLARLELSLAAALVLRSGLRGLHAGGVVVGDGATLFTGPGGSGKSSLTAGFAARAAPVLGDDVVLLGDGRVHAFRRLLKVEEPARALLGLPPPAGPLAETWSDAGFYHPADLGSRWSAPVPVRRIVVPARSEGARFSLQERSPAETLPLLLRGLVPVQRVEPRDFEVVTEMLGGVRCYRLSYPETAAAVAELLDAWG